MPQEDEKNQALKFAMKLLALRRRSVFELQTRLKDKGFGQNLAQEVIDEMNRFGYLNDALFAESYINDRLNFRPAGRYLIMRELKLKGIDQEIISEKMAELLPFEKELELAGKLVRKKMKTVSTSDPYKLRTKIMSYLQTKGFSSEIISQAMQNNIKLSEDKDLEKY